MAEPAVPGVEEIARALCAFAIRQRRKWDTPPDEVEAMIAQGDVIDLAWRDFVGEAEVAHGLIAPILAEKERLLAYWLYQHDQGQEEIRQLSDNLAFAEHESKALEARALAAEAALAGERERCAKIADSFAEACFREADLQKTRYTALSAAGSECEDVAAAIRAQGSGNA